MTAHELAANLRSELHDVSHARMRDVLRRDIERMLPEEKRRELAAADRAHKSMAAMMRRTER